MDRHACLYVATYVRAVRLGEAMVRHDLDLMDLGPVTCLSLISPGNVLIESDLTGLQRISTCLK